MQASQAESNVALFSDARRSEIRAFACGAMDCVAPS